MLHRWSRTLSFEPSYGKTVDFENNQSTNEKRLGKNGTVEQIDSTFSALKHMACCIAQDDNWFSSCLRRVIVAPLSNNAMFSKIQPLVTWYLQIINQPSKRMHQAGQTRLTAAVTAHPFLILDGCWKLIPSFCYRVPKATRRCDTLNGDGMERALDITRHAVAATERTVGYL